MVKSVPLVSARLARYDIPLAANEVHYNLLHRQPEVDGVLDACRELGVALVAYVPLASGRLASTSSSSTRGSEALQTVLSTIVHKRNKSVPQVALTWLLRRDEHIIPIPGATSARHVQENAEALTWELSDEEFAAIDQGGCTINQKTPATAAPYAVLAMGCSCPPTLRPSTK
jgi:aryl-alcohol dehydrogenase-like predicted oxidoreductase